MNDRIAARDAIQNTADMMSCAAALIQLGEDADALKWLSGIRKALEQAEAAGDWTLLHTILMPQFGTSGNPDIQRSARKSAEELVERLKEEQRELREGMRAAAAEKPLPN